MIRFACSAVLALVLSAQPAHAWGVLGHRVSATIAERNISGRTRAHVEQILGATSLPEISTYPDEQRQNPEPYWQNATPWHRVPLPRGKSIAEVEHPASGNAITALERSATVLRDPAASPIEKQRALAFAVHLVADTHLPVHFISEPYGGGDFPVLWFGEGKNMHWAFEEGLLAHKLLSASEYAEQLDDHVTPQQVLAYWSPDPRLWMQESVDLREKLFAYIDQNKPATGVPMELGFRFVYDWTPAMEQRLVQSGYRTAAYLDWVFAAPGASEPSSPPRRARR